MDEQYYGTTLLFGGSFAPRNFAFCNGQIESIAQNQALFSILGTFWGGDGRTSFGLPDLRGRTPVGFGDGPGLPSAYPIGAKFGVPTHVLSHSELPTHSHEAVFTPTGGSSGTPISATATVNAGTGSDASDPSGKYWGTTKNGLAALNSYSNSADKTMAVDAIDIAITGGGGGITGGEVAIATAGNSTAFALYQPSTVIPFIICVNGLYPSRN
ncbi:phage tail protein [Terasakiella pusilla]|uniref:phage tail protein n=1 Tax=Terasakiella pusilla TaxID=64973 RepID=UPI003AA9AE46